MTAQTALAIVSHPYKTTTEGKKEPNWNLEHVTLPTPGPHELVVEIIATGICHTDIALSLIPTADGSPPKPTVLGHEGSGYIRALGNSVNSHKIGDKVLLSFKYCQTCEQCMSGHPGFCEDFQPNLTGTDGYFISSSGESIKGQIFGQSSFSSFSIVAESSVVNVGDLLTEEELRLFAPLGCGIQTGSGAMINIAKVGQMDRVVVMGLGAVGMSAVMAAKYMGCKTIIAIDRVQNRIDLALELGATHGINTSKTDVEKEVMGITLKKGATVVADTTGYEPLFNSAMKFLSRRGKLIIIGICSGDYKFHADKLMTSGQQILGCVEGDSIPSEHIPKMIQMYRDGHLPFDRLVKEYPAADFQKALHAMEDGSVIKPILIWK